MKTIKLCFAIACVLTLASCSFQVYPTKSLSENYAMRMNTPEELAVKSKVKIFLSENDVKEDFKVIAFLTYSPPTIPIFMSQEKEMNKKFYEKVVMKAQELGGNGIIIMGGGYCKVINITNWDADDEAPATFVNVIFDRTVMDKFLNGSVAKIEKRSERKREESAFKSEIEANIDCAKELDEVSFIREKISAFEQYNSLLAKPSSSVAKDLEEMRTDLNKVEKKIKARLKRAEKKAAKVASQPATK